MPEVITFGEIMMRLAPEGFLRFLQADRFGVTYSGAEANVAVALASFGLDCAFVSRLPKNEIGQSALNFLRKFGVNVDFISRPDDGRTGIYFLEKGAGSRPSRVIYDRAGSAISLSSPSDYDWDKIFDSCKIFMLSGITPALSENLADICLQACKKAREKGITVVFDLNYRKKLWTVEEARKVMEKICSYVDICITNEEDASLIFGIEKAQKDFTSLDIEGYKRIASELSARFAFKKVCITLRESKSASENGWAGLLYTGDGNFFLSKKYQVHIVDRVGAGDAFTAGIIYGEIKKMDCQSQLDFAAASGCLKHTVEGDFNLVSLDEVLSLAGGNTGGRVER